MKKIFIDGREGTTGLRIYERLATRNDIEVIVLPDTARKNTDARREAINDSDITFLCLPDEAAIEAVSLCENDNTVIIDASTAHRTDPVWAYGFPELSCEHYEKILASKRIAVPGCHAGGFIALVYPLVKAGIVQKNARLFSYSLTGYSGGGKKTIAEYESEVRSIHLNAPRQYALTQRHKHLPEMKAICSLEYEPVFCPVIADYYSGMEVTVPLFAGDISATADDIRRIYRQLYTSPLVNYRDSLDENGFAAANALSGIDRMEITVAGNDERILLISRFDNLGKGASGAAVECMNLKLGCEITKCLEL